VNATMGRPEGTRLGERAMDAPGPMRTATWTRHLRAVDHALGASDVPGAQRAWEQAHLAAVESLSWEGLIATGHACLRIGRAAGAGAAAEPTARRAYFAALYRACRENSFDGILRAAEAFADLGDGEVVEECLGLAELQVDGEDTRQRLSTLVQRLGVALPPDRSDGAARASGLFRPGLAVSREGAIS
jgi:hypothetical protein